MKTFGPDGALELVVSIESFENLWLSQRAIDINNYGKGGIYLVYCGSVSFTLPPPLHLPSPSPPPPPPPPLCVGEGRGEGRGEEHSTTVIPNIYLPFHIYLFIWHFVIAMGFQNFTLDPITFNAPSGPVPKPFIQLYWNNSF